MDDIPFICAFFFLAIYNGRIFFNIPLFFFMRPAINYFFSTVNIRFYNITKVFQKKSPTVFIILFPLCVLAKLTEI